MVKILLLDGKGWELPDFFSIGPDTFDGLKEATDIVIDAISHHCSMNKLAGVETIRVIGTDDKAIDIPRDVWCYW